MAKTLTIEFDPEWGAPMVSPHPLYVRRGEEFNIQVKLPNTIKMVLVNFVDPDHLFFPIESGGKATGWHKESQNLPTETFDVVAVTPTFTGVSATVIKCKYSITGIRADGTVITLDPDIVVRQ